MATPIDSIVSKVESYIGEFLLSRERIIEAGKKIDAGISAAQVSGEARIGDRTFSLAELSALKSENEELLSRNATIHGDYLDFRKKVDDFLSALSTEEGFPYFPGIAGEGMGVVQIAVPAAALVAAGAVLAGSIALFLSNYKSHVAKVAGTVWTDLWWLAALGIGAYIYFNRRTR